VKIITFETLNSVFSTKRLSTYLVETNSSDQVLTKYNSNIMLSEAMIPTLHYLEICLRNRINQVLRRHYSSSWLMAPSNPQLISEKDVKKINEIISKIERGNKIEVAHDDVVAQMTFGFWSSFFHRKYDPLIWHRKDTFKIVFPNLSRIHRKRSYVEDRIIKIKMLRNRIAHHEPVWNLKTSILDINSMCYELIEAISYDAINMLKMIDRFPKVYASIFEVE
jgi:hypothetical protein